MTYAEQNAAVDAACARFPAVFGLRDPRMRGERFRVNRSASYWTTGVDREPGAYVGPMLYTQRINEAGIWNDYAKGTPAELEREMIALPAAT